MSRNLAILGVIAVLLGGYAAFDWFGGGASFMDDGRVTPAPATPASAGGEAAGSAAKLNPLEGLAAERFPDVVEKPLFNPGRAPRPAEPPPPPPPPPPEVEPQPEVPPEAPVPNAADYQLLAVSAGPSGSVAALRLAATGEVLYLREGQPVGEWSVISVSDRSIVIGTPDNNVTLNLFESNGAEAGAPPGQEVPPPQPEMQLPPEDPPPPENPPPPPAPPGDAQPAPEPGQ